ncbi:MAG: hypothetical protein M1838_000279 [Thelocarpon superellum]|nr:MAG: hypothetical protein M1838_000279 [Thelocarpon superellum]
MTSFFSRFSPVPGFPDHTGPYRVGTIDIELPAARLSSPAPAPDPTISTVQFRLFYPCDANRPQDQHVRWMPHPQREYVGAYAKFLGAKGAFVEILSRIPQLLYYITIPVHANAPLLTPPTKTKRWPVMVFSHGLGGTRNAYSHLVGSLASRGMVVIAPEHRDGSTPVSFIRDLSLDGEVPTKTALSGRRAIPYRSVPFQPTTEAELARNEQLRIRLWELGLIHEAVLQLEAGEDMIGVDASQVNASKAADNPLLRMFEGQLDVHDPGSVSWAGHSFGAATVIQFVKSVFYRPTESNQLESDFSTFAPLFTPSASSNIAKQITPKSPVIVLDLWTAPLRGNSTRWLWNQPLPTYASSGPGGVNVLAILSDAFFKWKANLESTKQILAENTTLRARESTKPGPRMFYVKSSAHLSQSDFGVLFPWFTKRILKAHAPERTLALNVRAISQVLRESGVEVAGVTDDEREIQTGGKTESAKRVETGDWKILARDGDVEGWVVVDPDLDASGEDDVAAESAEKSPNQAVVQGEVGNDTA